VNSSTAEHGTKGAVRCSKAAMTSSWWHGGVRWHLGAKGREQRAWSAREIL
jgi:hypothetical protein